MEFCNEKRRSDSSSKTIESQDIYGDGKLAAVMEELKRTKEEIKKAKENSIRLWLSSRPLIEELDKLQINLSSAKNRFSTSVSFISNLESQLNGLNETIGKKHEAENVSELINEITHATDMTLEEIEEVKIETNKKRRERSKLKQVFKLRSQRLRALKLTLRAVRLESDAFGASADEAVRYIDCSQVDDLTVRLGRDEYYDLTRKAKDETSLAEWRVSVAMEQKPVAEKNREVALRRLRNVYSMNRSMEKIFSDEFQNDEKSKDDDLRIREVVSPKSRVDLQGSKGSFNKKIVKKQKPVGLFPMTTFFSCK